MAAQNAAYELGLARPNREIVLEDLPVRGTIPDWLDGVLLRNGPGTFQAGGQALRHWFDGLSMLHRFAFRAGRVNYMARFLNSQTYQGAQDSGGLTLSEFATDPCRSLFKKVMTLLGRRTNDDAKVSLTRFANRYLALAETPIQVEFDPETLASAGVFVHEPNLVGQTTTAHPHFDERGESMYNLVTRYHAICHYRLYRTRADFVPAMVGSLPVRQPSYMHSFGMSQNHFIVTEFPFVVDPLALLLWLRPFIENFTWQPRRGTPFHLINRHTGELVKRYEADAFFAFHHVNAFERGGEVFVDLVGYPDAGIITDFYLHRLQDPALRLPHGQLRRYRLNPARKTAEFELLAEDCIEMPRTDYTRVNTRADYRFVYGIGLRQDKPHGFYNQIVKLDTAGGPTKYWYADGCYPGEPVFVPAPGSRTEDDGVILSVVLDAQREHSYLLALDARSFSEMGRAEVPQPILFGFHGDYFG